MQFINLHKEKKNCSWLIKSNTQFSAQTSITEALIWKEVFFSFSLFNTKLYRERLITVTDFFEFSTS